MGLISVSNLISDGCRILFTIYVGLIRGRLRSLPDGSRIVDIDFSGFGSVYVDIRPWGFN